ncbi:hypothetical protein DLJ53_33435 [Acuticoccus sediminis]|uniref:Uncharacterized protein n=1 Tax=Acuticoccus sediminis TaxID=2184697 RepID=A0A8B2NNI1_9HYPH|nr:hypothetical protein [Acuticoccus sediminis]RAH96053.1 hypothetical protein DLJ53_33435 [Acuticoccus sediminis]
MRLLARLICGILANPLVFFAVLGVPVFLWLEEGMNPWLVLLVWVVFVPLSSRAASWREQDANALRPYRPKRRRPPKVEPEPEPALVSLTLKRSRPAEAEYPELAARLPPPLVRLVTEGLVRVEQENSGRTTGH